MSNAFLQYRCSIRKIIFVMWNVIMSYPFIKTVVYQFISLPNFIMIIKVRCLSQKYWLLFIIIDEQLWLNGNHSYTYFLLWWLGVAKQIVRSIIKLIDYLYFFLLRYVTIHLWFKKATACVLVSTSNCVASHSKCKWMELGTCQCFI